MSFLQRDVNQNVKLNQNVKRLNKQVNQEKKWFAKVIDLILSDNCPEHVRKMFFINHSTKYSTKYSAVEHNDKIREHNDKIRKILIQLKNGETMTGGATATATAKISQTRSFQPSEGLFHPSGCQCDDIDCVHGFFRDPTGIIHPEDCFCDICRTIDAIYCCCSILCWFFENTGHED